MYAKLKQLKERAALNCTVFEVEMDAAAQAAMAKDPMTFFGNLLKQSGQVVNRIAVDPGFTGVSGGAGVRPPRLYHCESPPDAASTWITIQPL